MPTTFGLRGANSMTFQQTGGSEVISSATLIAGQPTGQLLTFLSATYASAAAAETAFRDLGGEIVVRATAGTDPVAAEWGWGVNNFGALTLVVADAAADNVFEVKVRIEHSITR